MLVDTDQKYKIISVMHSKIGKSCFLQRFVFDSYPRTFTIASDLMIKKVTVHDEPVKLYLWDCSMNERVRYLTKTYCQGADACFVGLDITDRQSFNQVGHWLGQLEGL